MPDYRLETTLGALDGRRVIGLDEAGRGPWAGPVVAGAVWLDPAKLALLREGRTPIIEAGMGDLIAATVASGRLTVTDDVDAAVRELRRRADAGAQQ